MKLLLTICIIFTACCTLTAQETPVVKKNNPTSESLMAKSRRQNTAGWLLIGGGLLAGGSGIIAGFFSFTEEITGNDGSKNENKARILFYTGTAAMATGIGFVIASAATKRKAKLAMGTGQLWLTPRVPLGPAYATVKLTVAL